MGHLKAALVGATTSLLCTLLLLSAAYARADERAPQSFDIRAQSLAAALSEFARQSHEEILFAPDIVAEKRSGGVRGTMQSLAALKILLNDSGLPFSSTPSGTILIGQAGATPAISTAEAGNTSQKEGKKNSSQDFRVAQVDQGANSQSSTVVNDGSTSQDSLKRTQLTEIIVTAQKRDERLQDVPVPVTAIGADTLIVNDQVRLQDFYTTVPGLTVTPASTQGYQLLSIRGITTGGGTNPTVGVTVDDVPFGSSTNLGGGLVLPDIDPNDLARIEVLRGPQGTLYGANSMGGLVKFVTADPSTAGLSGRVQAGLDSVSNGAELGYNARGSVNVPLGDTFAIRASGFTRQDPGYIDNPVLHINGINEEHVNGGRLSALWRPSESFSLKLNALIQDTKVDGSNDVDVPSNGYVGPALGDLQQNYLPGVGGNHRHVQAYSAILTAKLGSVDLTAVSGYNVTAYHDSWDLSYAYRPFGIPGAIVTDQDKTSKFTQEVRLSTALGPNVQWLVGGFYTHESSHVLENILEADPTTGGDIATLLTLGFPTTYEEYAGFTDLTFNITDRFDVQIGGRETEIRQTFSQTESGPFAGPNVPQLNSSANAFTYLATPRFKISPDLMVYARLASGYRAGGSNTSPGGIVPAQYNPDKTQNYELGVKGDFLDRTLTVDASLYHIDWKDIQLQLLNPKTEQSYNFNGSRAKSQGVELSVESRPLPGLTIGAWVVWDDAELTEAFPATSTAYGVPGDQLPYGSRFSGNVSLEQAFPITGSLRGFVGGTASYVGSREGVFTGSSSTARQYYPAYSRTDLRLGARYDAWTADIYVNNVADKRGVLSGGVGQFPPFAFAYIQPRMIGLSLVREF